MSDESDYLYRQSLRAEQQAREDAIRERENAGKYQEEDNTGVFRKPEHHIDEEKGGSFLISIFVGIGHYILGLLVLMVIITVIRNF